MRKDHDWQTEYKPETDGIGDRAQYAKPPNSRWSIWTGERGQSVYRQSHCVQKSEYIVRTGETPSYSYAGWSGLLWSSTGRALSYPMCTLSQSLWRPASFYGGIDSAGPGAGRRFRSHRTFSELWRDLSCMPGCGGHAYWIQNWM